jgi:hypothetical protein
MQSDGQSVVQSIEGEKDDVVCNKCGKKGHVTKDCKEELACVNCGKGHISNKCTWLKQKKLIASLVGFGGPGLACFVADHAKDIGNEEKGKVIAIVAQ